MTVTAEELGELIGQVKVQKFSARLEKYLKKGNNIDAPIWLGGTVKMYATLLGIAAEFGYLEEAQLLISKGAALDHGYNCGRPLIRAIVGNCAVVANLLISKGATVTQENAKEIANRLGMGNDTDTICLALDKTGIPISFPYEGNYEGEGLNPMATVLNRIIMKIIHEEGAQLVSKTKLSPDLIAIVGSYSWIGSALHAFSNIVREISRTPAIPAAPIILTNGVTQKKKSKCPQLSLCLAHLLPSSLQMTIQPKKKKRKP